MIEEERKIGDEAIRKELREFGRRARLRREIDFCRGAIVPILRTAQDGNSRDKSKALYNASEIAERMGARELSITLAADSWGYHLKAEAEGI